MGRKGSLSVPDRWLNYDPIGRDVEGTRFVPFKTPLKAEIFEANRSLHPDDHWDIRTLISYAREAGKKIGLVIDLTFTDRYYESREWKDHDIEFAKIKCAGKEVRFLERHVREFNRVVDDYIARNPDDSLIGVHCTHGLNRTGYYICRYLIERLNWTAEDAINQFEYNRGHPMEHRTFKESLFDKNTRPPPIGSGQYKYRTTVKKRNETISLSEAVAESETTTEITV